MRHMLNVAVPATLHLRRLALLVLTLAGVLQSVISAHAAPVPFNPPVKVCPDLKHWDYLGDCNGDGKADIIGTNDSDIQCVFESQSGSSFAFMPYIVKLTSQTNFSVPYQIRGDFPLQFFDMNGDGHVECLFVVEWYEKPKGSNTTYGWEGIMLGRYSSHGEFLCRLVDSICGDDNTLNDSVTWRTYGSIDCVDLDGNGRLDILSHSLFAHDEGTGDDSYISYDNERVLMNIGQGGDGFPSLVLSSMDLNETERLFSQKAVDLNHDGLSDLLMEEDLYAKAEDKYHEEEQVIPQHAITLRRGIGQGRFGPRQILWNFTASGESSALDCVDYNHDQRDEILINDKSLKGLRLNFSANGVTSSSLDDLGTYSGYWTGAKGSLLLRRNNDFYQVAAASNAKGFATQWIMRDAHCSGILGLRDFDRDGRDDILAMDDGNTTSPAIKLWRNNGSNGFQSSTVTTGIPAAGIFDLDADRFPDLIYTRADGAGFALYEMHNHFSDIFTPYPVASPVKGAAAVCTADLDGDGHLDLLSAAADDNGILWHRSGGQPHPAFTTSIITKQVCKPAALCAADLNRDGRPDVVVASSGDGTIAWLENKGVNPPAFTKHTLTTSADGAAAVAAADLDRDGDLDLLAASAGNDTLWWFENNGKAAPAFTAHKLSTSADGACAVGVADLDGDGDLDVICGSKNDNKIRWFENDGKRPPSFTAHTVTSSADGVRAVCAADLNHDGRLDLVAASADDNTLAWYENSGARPPSFTRHVITSEAKGACAVGVADLDGDGDQDMLVAAPGNGEITWYENDGQSPLKFWRRLVSSQVAGVKQLVLADMNGDARPDVIGALGSADKVLWFENGAPALPRPNAARAWGLYP